MTTQATKFSSFVDGEEKEVFFDSLDRSLSSEFVYQVWEDEPLSVEERRKNFLRQMGFVEERLNTCDESVSSRFDDSFEKEEEESLRLSTEESPEIVGEEFNECRVEERQNLSDDVPTMTSTSKTMRSWWKWFVKTRKQKRVVLSEEASNNKAIKVSQSNKRFLELTALYSGQEIRAHEGFVWAMKFSPDRKYLASGGEDGVVRVWRVSTVEASSDHFGDGNLCSKLQEKKFGFKRKHPVHAPVGFPDRVLRIEESPVHEFRGHSGDVLDLAWSTSNRILSSSMDKTVRLWELGCDESVNVFHHNDYVTCIEFNPVDENYFISGSIDGKVRIWGSIEKRVVDWSDARDLITAVTYQPDGKGFMVGTMTGTFRSYKSSGECMVLESKINISGRKKSTGNKITGIKFSHDNPQRVMISSEDSKIRIFDGVDLVHKYKGLGKSGSQTSASFTNPESHIVSVGDDSRVYIWNNDRSPATSSARSCEHFSVRGGVSVAVPWPGTETRRRGPSAKSWFVGEGPSAKGSAATWPEEKLPLCDSSDLNRFEARDDKDYRHVSEAWGLVIVAAGLDGTIRTIHNYGLPIRI